jgi:AraC family transcriptional regulator, transcriptional activator FtrA
MPQRFSQPSSGAPHRVVLLVDEGSNPFEIGCACEIFGPRRRAELGFEPYSLVVATPEKHIELRDSVLRVSASGGLDQVESAETLIVPNRPDVSTPTRPSVLNAIREAHARGTRLVGLCTGAFTLAEAGVLDGRPAAVHWQLADDFRRRHPSVPLDPDVLFVDDGDVLTSAGSAAALDLGLHIVRRDYGAEIATYFSRRLVFATARAGNQKQFVETPLPPTVDQSLTPLLSWASEHLDDRITVSDLAAHANVSVTTLHRRFVKEVGTTPLAWLTASRIEMARRMLERSDAGLDRIAQLSGLGTATNLRAQIRRHTGLSPSQYRAHHQARKVALA